MSFPLKWNRIYGTNLIQEVICTIDDIPVDHKFICKSCNKLIDVQDSLLAEEMAKKLEYKCVDCMKENKRSSN